MIPATGIGSREAALLAAEWTCPRCGAPRAAASTYCIECGLQLPERRGAVASFRRRWVRRLGWYPGDWVWIPLLSLVIAAAGAAAAIVVSQHRSTRNATLVATGLSAKAGPTARQHANGRFVWPARRRGWTVVLASYPQPKGLTGARATAARAARARLVQVGTLDSSNYASLNPGYDVVFSGIYASAAEAQNALGRARQAGFGAAHTAQIAR
jgi:hypothetical protein